MRRSRRFVVGVGALVVIAACGGSDDGDGGAAESAGDQPVAATGGGLYDPDDDGPIPTDRVSRQGLAAFLDEQHADASWYRSINQTGTLGATTLQVGGVGIEEEALAVCAAALDYASAFPDVVVEVVDSGSDADLAVGTEADGCATVSTSAGDDDALPDIEDPLYDPFFDDPVDPDVVSIDGIRLYLDLNHPTARWRPALGAFGFFDGLEPLRLEVGGANIEVDALDVCAALVAYGEQFTDAVEVEVSTYEPTDVGGVGEEIPVVRGTEGGCSPIE